jgi:hypothetical protein
LKTNKNVYLCNGYSKKGCEADEYKDVANKSQIVVFELMGYDSLQFFFGQELPFLAIRADMELRTISAVTKASRSDRC